MSRVESRYIDFLDRGKQERVTGQGPAAERFVKEFYDGISGLKARAATTHEDSGAIGGGGSGKMVDVVVYEQMDKKITPAMGIQVTTDIDPRIIDQKYYRQLRQQAFMRLEEMKREDVAIPRVLVILKPEKIRNLNENPTPKLRRELSGIVLDASINSLIYDLQQTKTPKEQNHIEHLISKLEAEKKKLSTDMETVH